MSLTWWVSGNGLWMSPQGPNTNYVCLYGGGRESKWEKSCLRSLCTAPHGKPCQSKLFGFKPTAFLANLR